MRVLILGQAKSGTTALHHALLDALPGAAESFEPLDLREVDLTPENLVVKKLVNTFAEVEMDVFDAFDKHVFLVRDPRDRLVSWLMYDLYGRPAMRLAEKVELFVERLRQKEADPGSVELVRLVNLYWDITGMDLITEMAWATRRTLGVRAKIADRFFTVHYEDMVAGDLAGLSDHLGLGPIAVPEVTGERGRVVRSKGIGDWRHWFTEIDIMVFRPMLQLALHEYGYAPEWELASPQVIDPATSSEYVLSLAERAREEGAADAGGSPAAPTDG